MLQFAPESTAFDMIGPYLAAKVVCTGCHLENILVHTEGPASPVKPVDVCSHIRAYFVDEDGLGTFEFEV
ncbi:hypothetical protein [Aquipseudomonas alcaligenes]|uniref:Uncharacterized protein n=1 Tax=Aquipseudomonas alcaligenes TaxID=43263 RepID=A0A1N6X9S8_AQUAC|nr:hypothetical protein [Pseudomonas alcaligenes]SIQ99073.1 hypothetical protein SAMN05878282_11243 [Pseudomonas alcaligenes]